MRRDDVFAAFRVDLPAGRLFWLNPSKFHRDLIGKEAGIPQHNRKKSYWVIRWNGRAYKRGHLIFCVIHDRLPTPCLDHINGNSLDDSPQNIREATIVQNAWNHKTRARRIPLPMGVRLIPGSGRFQARISFLGEQIHLGAFDTPQEAETVYQAKRKDLYGPFA